MDLFMSYLQEQGRKSYLDKDLFLQERCIYIVLAYNAPCVSAWNGTLNI